MKKFLLKTKKTFGDILFAAVFATIIGALFMKSYAIPTSSMENTLLVGDHMFVSKFHYGARLPQTPLQIPLTHQKIWGTEIPSYLDWVQLPYYRLPGLTKIKRNDIVVFHFPGEREEHPLDLRTYYIKRCVGTPGDSLRIIDNQIYVNGKSLVNKGSRQYGFHMTTERHLSDRFFKSRNISEYYTSQGGYVIFTDSTNIEKLSSVNYIDSIYLIDFKATRTEDLFADLNNNWNMVQYGPVYIPKKGDQIMLNADNIARYKEIILYFEGNSNFSFKEGKILQNNKILDHYVFKQDYYFMMGDNRHRSLDSRYWGLVPEDHLVGKPLFIYWSVGQSDNLIEYFSEIRWERLFNWVADS